MWHAMVPMFGVFGRYNFIWRNYHGGSRATGRGIGLTLAYSSRRRNVHSCRWRWCSWDILWAAQGWHVTPRSWRQYRTGMLPIKSKAFDSLLTSSGIIDDLLKSLVALTRKEAPFVWTDRQQAAFESLKACRVSAPILGFPTESGRFVLDTDASLFAVGGVLSQLQNDSEVVIAQASRSLRLPQRRYCMTRREMLAAVVMCTHFRSYLRVGGAQLTLGGGGGVRCRQCIRRFRTLNLRRSWWISLSPRRRWVSLWMQTYCRSCPAKLGWHRRS